MTPAELARYSAISFECKKDSLRQTQAGTWKIAFTVQGLDMDERLTKAFPGTRYMAVLVEVDDLEMPVSKQPEKENSKSLATPQLAALDKSQPVGAKRMDWRELQPAAQAGIRCDDPVFNEFLKEKHPHSLYNSRGPAAAVRWLCGVDSRSELGTKHAARVIWHQLDEQFMMWKLAERVGA